MNDRGKDEEKIGRDRGSKRPRRNLKRYLLRVLLVAVGLCVGALLVEILLRFAGIEHANFYRWDEVSGTALRPGARGWWRKEGKAYITINAEGLRDRPHQKAKSPRVIRVAVLGDSYAEAFQVSMEETFWSVIEKKLGECPSLSGQRIECINFGVSGYGTAQELLTLRHRVWDYSPDVVILAFLPGNDIRNNSEALEGNPLKPYFVFRDGELLLDDSFRSTRAFRLRQTLPAEIYYWILAHSRLMQATIAARARIRSRRSKVENAPSDAEAGLDNMIYREPTDPVWKDAWIVTDQLILQMHREVEQRGARFLLVMLTNGIQVVPDPQTRMQFVESLKLTDLAYPEHRIANLAQKAGIDFLNLVPPFRDYAESNGVYLHGFGSQLGSGHWNAQGHRLAGNLISDRLCSDFFAVD